METQEQDFKFGEPDNYGSFPYLYAGQWNKGNLNQILKERLPESYDMQLVDQTEIEILAAVVNIGIDAHLEAATRTMEPHAVPMMVGDRCFGNKYGIGFDRKGMICLIRRLMEFSPSEELIQEVGERIEDEELTECYGDTREEKITDHLYSVAYQFVSCILETLQLEYSGC